MKQKLWCCVDTNFGKPIYFLSSLAYTRFESIIKLKGTSNFDWDEYKKLGFKCIKVEVIIKPINEVK